MTRQLTEVLSYLEEYLAISEFSDYCPNGLQVEGRPEITRLVSGVTANQALIEAAVEWGADAILVHHGYFWKGEDERVVGMKRRRLGALLAADVSLLAYHLPLDGHPVVGNNACLGRFLGLGSENIQPLGAGIVGSVVDLAEAISAAELYQRLANVTRRPPLHIGDDQAELQRIAWCTGAAQGYIEQAVAAGADAFITGEASEPTVHIAREEGVQFFAAGHHATERFGVQALGAHLAERFGLEHRYIDIDNPV